MPIKLQEGKMAEHSKIFRNTGDVNRFMWASIVLLIACGLSLAEVKLPRIIGDNMVLQRDTEIRLWGWADRNEKIAIVFNDHKVTTSADKNGKWQVTLPAMPAGGPYTGSAYSLCLRSPAFGQKKPCYGESGSNAVQPQSRISRPWVIFSDASCTTP
jgi:sialate O-acetylesterase